MSSLAPRADSDDEAQILNAVDRFLERDVEPVAHDLEHADEWPADIVAKMTELGLFGATISAEYGGLGLSASTYTKIVERIGGLDERLGHLQLTPDHGCSGREIRDRRAKTEMAAQVRGW